MLDTALIFDAALLPAMIVALAAGVLSFLSPCVLPVVPPYLAYMGAFHQRDGRAGKPVAGLRRRTVLVLGLSTVLLLGMAFSALGRMMLQWQDAMLIGAGVLIKILGAHFIGVFRIGFLDRECGLMQAIGVGPPLVHGPRLCIWLDAVSWADLGAISLPRQRLTCRAAHPIGAHAIGLGIRSCWSQPSFSSGSDGLDETSYGPTECTSGLLFNRWPDDDHRTVCGV